MRDCSHDIPNKSTIPAQESVSKIRFGRSLGVARIGAARITTRDVEDSDVGKILWTQVPRRAAEMKLTCRERPA